MWIRRKSLGALGVTSEVQALAEAISRQEGTIRNNNPGNIMDMSTGTLRVYPTLQDGWNALYNQVQLNIDRGLNLYEFFGGKTGVYGGYAPAGHGGNDPVLYANNVASWTGLDPNIPLNQADWTGTPAGSPLDDYSAPQEEPAGGSWLDYFTGPSTPYTGSSEASASGIPVMAIAAGALVLFLVARR